MTSRLLSLFRIFAPRHPFDNPNSWRYIALWRQWLKEQYEEKEEQQAQLMDVVKDLLTPPDPIQSDHARQVRYDSLQDWRRMMVQQQQQQYPTNNVTAPCRNTSNPATSTATNTLRDGTTPTTPRRVPTTNHFIVEAVPDLTIPVGDARVALAQ